MKNTKVLNMYIELVKGEIEKLEQELKQITDNDDILFIQSRINNRKEELEMLEAQQKPEITIEYDGDRVTAYDGEGNNIFFHKKNNFLKPLCASFNGACYDKDGIHWKRCKRGAVSKAFYEWEEKFQKAIHDKHYNIK
ncbi:hypothetical protein ACU3L3_06965 [Priestia endophytica]